ncbi:MAG: hypothetical protein HY645_08775 [Acidobacteria bacterium]|nr:hypothetical protein [Acidobacteriota bacterium]
MIPIDPREATLIFTKWQKERTYIFCKGTCWGWEVFLKGYIIEATSEKVILEAKESAGVMGVQMVMNDQQWYYAEPREMSPELRPDLTEEGLSRSSLSVALPARSAKLVFCELPAEPS